MVRLWTTLLAFLLVTVASGQDNSYNAGNSSYFGGGLQKTETLVFRLVGAWDDPMTSLAAGLYDLDADIYITGVGKMARLERTNPTQVDTTNVQMEVSNISWGNNNTWPPTNSGYRAGLLYFGLDYLNTNGYVVKSATLHLRPNYNGINTAAQAATDSFLVVALNLNPQSATWRTPTAHSPSYDEANTVEGYAWPTGMDSILEERLGTASAAYNGVDYVEYDHAPLDITEIAKAAASAPASSWGGLITLSLDCTNGYRTGWSRATGSGVTPWITVEAIKSTSQARTDLRHGAGLPGGGWLHGGAIAHQSNVMAVGADVSGVYASEDGGSTWNLHNQGLMNSDEIVNHYVDEVVAVENNYFEGLIAGTYGGIYEASVTNGRLGDWSSMTPVADTDFQCAVPVAWDLVDGWLSTIGFSAVSWDGGDLMVAASGRYRWERNTDNMAYTAGNYPTGYISGGPAGGPWSLFKYDFSAVTPKWEPWGLYVPADWHIRDVSCATVGGNLLALCATSATGVKLFDGTSYIDLASRPWHNYQGETILPNWSPEALYRGGVYYDEQAIDGVWLTEDGTAFVALRNKLITSDVVSGVFVYADVTNLTTGSWEWVGDTTLQDGANRAMHDIGIGRSNTYPRSEFAYITGARGASSDRLYLSARSGGGCLVSADMTHGQDPRTVTWTTKMHAYTTATLWPMDTWFDNNITAAWGGAIFDVCIDPNDQDNILLHPNAKLYKSSNGGDSWTRSDGVQKGSLEQFNSTGYDETCANGLVVGSDGTAYYSAGDVGLYATLGTDWDWNEKIMPNGDIVDNCQTTTPVADWWDDDSSPNRETGFSDISHSFNGVPGSDILFQVMGDVIQGGNYNKLFAFYDHDQADGDPTKTWEHITKDLPNLDRYQFLSQSLFCNEDGTELFAAYLENSSSLCASVDAPSAGGGVLQFSYAGGVWSITDHASDLVWPQVAGDNTSATGHARPFTLAVVGSRLFVGLRHNSSWISGGNGGVMYKDLPAGPWVKCFGFDLGSTLFGDVKGLQTDGSLMYMLTRGGASHYGALWLCEDPLTTPATWIQLCNESDADKLIPPLDPASPLLADRWNNPTPSKLSYLMFDGGTMLIDPTDNQKVYFTLSGNSNLLTDYGGVWHYNRTTDTFTHLFPDHPSNGVGANRGGMFFSDAFNPPRIIYGTHCAGPYWFNYPGTD